MADPLAFARMNCGHEGLKNGPCPKCRLDGTYLDEAALGKVVELATHISESSAGGRRGDCDNPHEYDDGQWQRCGGCFPCLLDQLRTALTKEGT